MQGDRDNRLPSYNWTLPELNAGESGARSESSETLDVIKFFHRDNASVVSFLRFPTTQRFDRMGRPKGMEEIGSARVSELDLKMPVILPHLTYNAYFTINGLYDGGLSWLSPVGLRYVNKKKSNLRTFTTAYCDLDCGRPHSSKPEQRISAQEALDLASGMVSLFDLPPLSAFAFSGQGLYLFWRLHDRGEPLLSFRNEERYEAINDALYRRLRHLAADPNAKDSSRILRVPNSIHTKSGNRVSYQLFSERVYSLAELERELGLGSVRHYALPKPAKKMPNIPKMKGIIAMNHYRAEDILKIERHVGGWSEGERRSKITKFALCLRNATLRETETVVRCQEMAARCRPPFPEMEVERLVAGVYKGECYRFKSQTLCDAFTVTAALARQLGLKSIVPDQEREDRRIGKRTNREQRRAKLQSLIVEFVSTRPTATAREIQALCEEKGIKISARHVNRILKQLGIRVARRGCPRKSRISQITSAKRDSEFEIFEVSNYSNFGPFWFDEKIIEEANALGEPGAMESFCDFSVHSPS